MFFVMVEISNFRQLSRLRESEATEIRGLLEHFSQNRGGRLTREQNGFFLFSFHPLREKVLDQVSDFLFLTSESLQKRKDDLFGFSLLLEQDDADEAAVFNKLKALIFLAPQEDRVWAGPSVLPVLSQVFPVEPGDPLTEILGPPVRNDLPPLPVELLLEMTGWLEALRTPLKRQLSLSEGGTAGKILRLKGSHLTEKLFVLKTVLQQIYGTQEDFPVMFPLQDSRDFLSQLLARIDPDLWKSAPAPADPAWATILECRGGGDYPGDSGREDVVGALGHYFRAVVHHLASRNLPPVFVFLFPRGYEPAAQAVLESILGGLVADDGLRLLLLEPSDTPLDFLAGRPSLSWSFPALSHERILKERDARGWKERFPILDKAFLDASDGRGMAWVHHLWTLQQRRDVPVLPEDPSWTLFQSLDLSHRKVYFVLWAGKGLLDEHQLVRFFQQWGEDEAVVADKVENLRSMGYFLEGLSRPLRSDFGPRVAEQLGEEGRELLAGLGQFLYRQWKTDHRLSEVLFLFLRDRGLLTPAVDVLSYYLTNKINQGQGDFLPLLRHELWESAPTDDLKETFRLIAAAAKLRYSLNLRTSATTAPSLERFRRAFSPKTESFPNGEWQLQQGRYYLRMGDLSQGFALLKKALLEAQARDDRALEVRAETEIGLALLRKNRLEEGREYFEISCRLAEKTQSSYLVSLTSGLDAVSLFLLGHLTSASKAVDRGLAASEKGGQQQGKVFHRFLQGRIAFDLGDYPGAVAAFDRALAVAQRYQTDEALPVLGAWKGRAEGYAGNGAGARATLGALAPSAERSFFLSEVCHLDRDRAGALAHIRDAQNLVPETRPFGTGERVDWLTGFSAIEDRGLAQAGAPGVLQNQIEAFAAFQEGIAGNSAGAIALFQTLLSRKFLLDLDPASAQVYYWYYLTVPRNESDQEAFRLTLLGRALKDVQVRSSRIEDPVQRQDYLSKPHWNSQFSLEARRVKLM